jgi:hypothetical protein
MSDSKELPPVSPTILDTATVDLDVTDGILSANAITATIANKILISKFSLTTGQEYRDSLSGFIFTSIVIDNDGEIVLEG